MRKFSILLILIAIFSLGLTGCGSHQIKKGMNDEERYSAEIKRDVPQLQYYFTDNNCKIGVYYLGRFANVPLFSSEIVEHKNATFQSINYKASDISQELFNASKNTAISELISTDISNSVSFVTSDGQPATATLLSNAMVSNEYNVCNSLNLGHHNDSGFSFIDSFAYVNDFIKQKICNITYNVGLFAPEGFYRISLLSSCDFYAFAVYDNQSNKVSITYDLSVVKDSLYFANDSSTNRFFSASNGNKNALAFNTSALSNGELFDGQQKYLINYVLNEGSFKEPPVQYYTLSSINLSTPTLEYFDFGGWFLDEALTQPATNEALIRLACDTTVYAKWNTQTDVITWQGFTGLTSNIVNTETGQIKTTKVDNNKLKTYLLKGYSAKITFYYTAGVPYEYEGTSDPSNLKVQLGFSKDTTDSTFISKIERFHDSVANGTSFSQTIYFESALSNLQTYHVAVRLVIISNDAAILGICGKDAGTFSNLKMTIEYL